MRSIGGGMSEELRQNGIAATAEILEIWDTRWTINRNPMIGMKVRVQASDRPVFEIRIEKTTVSLIAVPQFQPGRFVPVRFDPKEPAVISVDFEGSASSALRRAPPATIGSSACRPSVRSSSSLRPSPPTLPGNRRHTGLVGERLCPPRRLRRDERV
jgi:hypothetical protein